MDYFSYLQTFSVFFLLKPRFFMFFVKKVCNSIVVLHFIVYLHCYKKT